MNQPHPTATVCLRRLILFSAWLLTACSPAAWLAPAPTPTQPEPIEMSACRLTGAAASAECGVLDVLEDRANPSGARIHLAVARIPSVSRSPQPDALFLIAGGPGQAATQAFLPTISAFDRIHQDRDIILVDQRGTGSSSPLTCPNPNTAQSLLAPDPSPSQMAEVTQACLKGLHADPRHYTTQDFTADLDQVRDALGYAQIDLLGVSYGTRAALEYLRAYPQRVRSLVLDGVAPPDWPIGADAPANADRAMQAILVRCAQDPACHAAFPALAQEFADLFASLDSHPPVLTLPDPASGEPIQLNLTHARAAAALYTLSYSAQTAALIPLLVHTAATGDPSRLAAQYLVIQRQLRENLADGLYLSVVCAEDAPFFPADPAGQVSYLPDGAAGLQAECAAWPHVGQPAALRQPLHSNVPVLLLSGADDPVTPPENAARVAQTLPNSLQLVASGLGHNVVFQGCLPRLTAEFIAQASPKGLDTVCVSTIRPDPFFLSFAGPMP
ncbi:MAG TPA: alpha/beta fold hydrolase [Anaerolineaceae bacterium]